MNQPEEISKIEVPFFKIRKIAEHLDLSVKQLIHLLHPEYRMCLKCGGTYESAKYYEKHFRTEHVEDEEFTWGNR